MKRWQVSHTLQYLDRVPVLLICSFTAASHNDNEQETDSLTLPCLICLDVCTRIAVQNTVVFSQDLEDDLQGSQISKHLHPVLVPTACFKIETILPNGARHTA